MKYYITTPIYYANDLPHIGHAYTTIAADVLARWYKLKGKDVFFLTGTDEHGAKIVQAAENNSKSPKEFCDFISGEFKKEWEALGIEYSRFIRTTEKTHKETVQKFFKKLFDEGKIYKKKYTGLYCIHCEKFLAAQDLNEDMCCPDHKTKPVEHSEENYFFKLSDYEEELKKILTDESHPNYMAVYPIERRNEILGKLKIGLQDISISRAALKWGIPLPFDENQVFYVWVDALLNYISGIDLLDGNNSLSKYWPCDLHITAKDILWFHSIIWPAMLLAYGIKLPKKLFAHGYFTVNGEKMSKTLGNVIKPSDMIEKYGRDSSRYLLLALLPFKTDGDISYESMNDKYNSDLANNLGNLVSRTITMIEKYNDGKVGNEKESGVDSEKISEIHKYLKEADEFTDSLKFNRSIELIQQSINTANKYIEEKAPWKMAKNNSPELNSVLFTLIRSIGLISMYLLPFMPDTSRKIWESIGEDGSIADKTSDFLKNNTFNFPKCGAKVIKPDALFPRIQSNKKN